MPVIDCDEVHGTHGPCFHFAWFAARPTQHLTSLRSFLEGGKEARLIIARDTTPHTPLPVFPVTQLQAFARCSQNNAVNNQQIEATQENVAAPNVLQVNSKQNPEVHTSVSSPPSPGPPILHCKRSTELHTHTPSLSSHEVPEISSAPFRAQKRGTTRSGPPFRLPWYPKGGYGSLLTAYLMLLDCPPPLSLSFFDFFYLLSPPSLPLIQSQQSLHHGHWRHVQPV